MQQHGRKGDRIGFGNRPAPMVDEFLAHFEILEEMASDA
jgi:hypothetical protein